MSPLAVALSLLVGGALGLLGGGGSILTVPILLYVVGMPAKEAIATSLLVVAGASFVATLAHARHGRICLRVAALFGGASMIASYFAGTLAHRLSGPWLLAAFTAIMLVAGLAMLRRTPLAKAGTPNGFRAMVTGTGVGAVTGLVGAGGGFLIVPALTMFAGLDLSRAIGTSLLIITLNSLAGFLGYAGHVDLDLQTALLITATAAFGSALGSSYAGRVKPIYLRRGFAALVLCMAVGMAIEQAPALAHPNLENYAQSLLGGALIGFAATLLLLGNGRIAGISGIVGGLLRPVPGDSWWRVWLLAGLLAGGAVIFAAVPQAFAPASVPVPLLIFSGLLVGFGTRLGNGCTSGHGVCGLSRFSLRSLVATLTFMLTGGLAAYVVQHVLPIAAGGVP